MQSKTKHAVAVALCAVILLSVFFAGQITKVPVVDRDVLFQLAAFNTFSSGEYAGTMSYADLAQHGDFGIGTFDGLDGEMIALNGVFYQVPSSGIPKQATATQTAPYATITFFEVDQEFTVTNLNYTQLRAYLHQRLPSKNAIYAIKVSGTFEWAQARSPQKQNEPYPNITEALKTQSVFNLSSVSASAVGFWFPQSMDGVDYAGYHLHIISDDQTAGGHLLDCNILNATVQVDVINRYQLILP